MKYLIVAVGVLALAACPTVPLAQRENAVYRVIELVNEGEIDSLMRNTNNPFLLDGEILALENDIEYLWTALRAAEFTFTDAIIRDITPVTDRSYAEFADTMDVAVFFEKYLSSDGTIVEIETKNGEFLLLLGSRRRRMPLVYGFKGPLL